ncbi:hypothetical protein PGIGA_G00163850 [Pangasianodon gigas]|uniref:Uncharacterized protein n=1 Tax=Pangasianodon gigas TaxID=30993 RepID=A0ACC5XRP1_PANGG|nr:hypothetical protein [Pangasianodon gigas]
MPVLDSSILNLLSSPRARSLHWRTFCPPGVTLVLDTGILNIILIDQIWIRSWIVGCSTQVHIAVGSTSAIKSDISILIIILLGLFHPSVMPVLDSSILNLLSSPRARSLHWRIFCPPGVTLVLDTGILNIILIDQIWIRSWIVGCSTQVHIAVDAPKRVSVSISPSGEIVEGSSVTLTCSSDANPPVQTYTWYKGRSSIGTGKTYTISSISSEDSGEYKCKSSNQYGENYSDGATLNVLYPPKNVLVSISPSGERVEGSSVTLTCSSDANPPVQTYTWYKTVHPSPPDDTYTALDPQSISPDYDTLTVSAFISSISLLLITGYSTRLKTFGKL